MEALNYNLKQTRNDDSLFLEHRQSDDITRIYLEHISQMVGVIWGQGVSDERK
jgi:hypothetical protein|tara:strand:+ start:891 stop:1049 length:159 start_codon:yes stop_codon:yes gene_type:complete